jgi:cytochrome P450
LNATASNACLLSDPATFANGIPHQEFARRRKECPVSWVEETALWRHSGTAGVAVSGSGYWAVTRYSTVAAVSRNPALFSSAARGAFLADPLSRQDLQQSRQFLVNMDPPQHRAIRRFVADAFAPPALVRLEAAICGHAEGLVREAVRRQQFDVVSDLAAELPLLVLADFLGMPAGDRTLLRQWGNNLVGMDDPEYSGGDIRIYKQTFLDALAYARDLASTKRRQPGDDLVSQLVAQRTDGMHLSEIQLGYLWIMLVVAGNESTRHLLTGSIQALMEWPDQRNQLAANPRLVPSAVDELLRWVSPVMLSRRTATQDNVLDGTRIRAGDKVVVYYTSANRDEEVFPAADRLDLARTPNPHFAFGVGLHACLGAHLARLEVAALLEALRPHLARLELDGPPVRLRSNFMNGLKSMPARIESCSISR